MKQLVKAGSTSRIGYVFIQDSTSTAGAGKTGLAFNTAGWKAYYVRPAGTATAITLATQTVTGAFSSGGFVEVDATNMPGIYRIDLPDAVFAAGVDKAVVLLSGPTGVAPLPMEYELVAFDPNDTVRLGLTALPNAAAEAAGGLYTRGTGAGQIAQDANGNVRVNVDTIKTNPVVNAGTITFPTTATLASTTNITAGTVTTATNVTTVNGLAAGVITAASIAADAITDAKVAADVTIASVTGAVGSVTGAVGSVTGAVGSVTGNVGGNVTGSVGSVATGGITAASFAANAITAAKLDPDVTTELQAGLATATALTTVEGKIDTIDANVDSILVDTGTDIPASIDALPTAVENADALMQRDSTNWEASAPLMSLGTAVMKAVHKIAPTGADLIIYRSDGSTPHAKQPLTTDATLEPIKEVGAAVTP